MSDAPYARSDLPQISCASPFWQVYIDFSSGCSAESGAIAATKESKRGGGEKQKDAKEGELEEASHEISGHKVDHCLPVESNPR